MIIHCRALWGLCVDWALHKKLELQGLTTQPQFCGSTLEQKKQMLLCSHTIKKRPSNKHQILNFSMNNATSLYHKSTNLKLHILISQLM